MRKRYSRDEKGRVVHTADVYTPEEHGIDCSILDGDAVKVVRRLHRHGFEAYIVGGAVRDLLLGSIPKDFDVATAATPNQIRRLFRNSRVIGRRFRLVHILFRDKVIEVSTFRSEDSQGFKNVYGSIDEDVMRRDFTANARYRDPVENTVIDYVGGVRDLARRRLREVIPLNRIFIEDPVRMIRAFKYATSAELRLPFRIRRRVRKDAARLADTPPSRITEELFKILNGKHASEIVRALIAFALLDAMLPTVAALVRRDGAYRKHLLDRLTQLDEARRRSGPLDRRELIVYLAADYLLLFSPLASQKRIPFRDAYYEIKEFLKPVTPANKEIEAAINEVFRLKKRLLDRSKRNDRLSDEPVAADRYRSSILESE